MLHVRKNRTPCSRVSNWKDKSISETFQNNSISTNDSPVVKANDHSDADVLVSGSAEWYPRQSSTSEAQPAPARTTPVSAVAPGSQDEFETEEGGNGTDNNVETDTVLVFKTLVKRQVSCASNTSLAKWSDLDFNLSQSSSEDSCLTPVYCLPHQNELFSRCR